MTGNIPNLYDAISSGAAHDVETFAEVVLRDALGWPIPHESFGELSYEWTPDEIGLDAASAGKLAAAIKQVPPLADAQPWGVFIIEMKEPELFRRERGMAGLLRRMLSGLVEKEVRKKDRPAWKREELLFILTHEYRDFRFAYFRNPPEGAKNAPLATFGWLHGDTHIRTLCEMNLPALSWPADPNDREGWIVKWASAFDVTKVTNQFYQDYESAFAELEADIKGISGKDEKRAYAQRLMNRLMFVYFVQRKGWLTFDGDTRYLRRLYAASEKAGDDFLDDRLHELFFNGFNLRSANASAKEKSRLEGIIGSVPYLNGGLFAHAADGSDVRGKARISRNSFRRILRLFETYNFTISESTPLEIEVAVDPEMLGKVFEELVTGRHGSGSYYTPRNVVSFMCREALKTHLGRVAGLEATAAAGLVDEGDASGLNQAAATAALVALDALKAVDPACGSGAYLLGLLHEIIAIHKSLFSKKLRRDSRSLYQSKLRIINNNLYGVDKDAFAVEVARLRLWLSLAVDSDEPQPLPNLDFKIETGDSLLSPNPETAGGEGSGKTDNIFRSGKIKRLEELKAQFLLEGDEAEKARLLQEINNLRTELRTPGLDRGFDWRLEFGEVFSRPNRSGSDITAGFDIVLANPPYVRHEGLGEDIKNALKRVYGHSVFASKADLYCYFYARGIELLRPGGVLAFISSNKWFKAEYGKKLRKWIGEKCAVRNITDFGDLPVFESAIAYPMIFVAEKKVEDAAKEVVTLFAEPKSLEPPYPDIKAVAAALGSSLPPGSLSGEEWRFADAESQDRFETMRRNGVPLGEYVEGKIFRGVLTGLNKAFVIDGATRERLIREDKRSAEIIKPMLAGKDIKRWRVEDRGRWLIVTRIGVDMKRYPAVFNHLSLFKDKLEARADQGDYWYELRACAYYDEFEKPKIMYPETSQHIGFAYSEKPYFPLKTLFTIGKDDLFLLSILNSKCPYDYLRDTSSVLLGDTRSLSSIYVSQLPIPHATNKDKVALESLARKCLAKRGASCQAEEAEINAITGKLYGV